MKAAVCRKFKTDLTIEQVNLAKPSPQQVRVHLVACAICHSDLFYMDGFFGGHLPAVYGHEAAGYVVEIGAQVSNVRVGDSVVVTLVRSCGLCLCCTAGHPTACQRPYDRVAQSPLSIENKPLEHGLGVGAFAEQVVVDHSQIVSISDDIPLDVASLLACSVITGFGAVTHSARVMPGATVAVIGAGGVGLNIIQTAFLAGARRIIAVDKQASKLDHSFDFGATDVVLAGDNMVNEIIGLCHGRGVNYAFVAVGATEACNAAVNILAHRGVMIVVGMPPVGAIAAYEAINLASYSQVIRGSKMGEVVINRDIPLLIDLYRQGRFKLDELISNRYSLKQINTAIANTRGGQSRRNLIIF